MPITLIPLYRAVDNRIEIKGTCHLAADVSQLIHQHPWGYISSALVSYIIYRLSQDEFSKRETNKDYVCEGLALTTEMYPNTPMK